MDENDVDGGDDSVVGDNTGRQEEEVAYANDHADHEVNGDEETHVYEAVYNFMNCWIRESPGIQLLSRLPEFKGRTAQLVALLKEYTSPDKPWSAIRTKASMFVEHIATNLLQHQDDIPSSLRCDFEQASEVLRRWPDASEEWPMNPVADDYEPFVMEHSNYDDGNMEELQKMIQDKEGDHGNSEVLEIEMNEPALADINIERNRQMAVPAEQYPQRNQMPNMQGQPFMQAAPMTNPPLQNQTPNHLQNFHPVQQQFPASLFGQAPINAPPGSANFWWMCSPAGTVLPFTPLPLQQQVLQQGIPPPAQPQGGHAAVQQQVQQQVLQHGIPPPAQPQGGHAAVQQQVQQQVLQHGIPPQAQPPVRQVTYLSQGQQLDHGSLTQSVNPSLGTQSTARSYKQRTWDNSQGHGLPSTVPHDTPMSVPDGTWMRHADTMFGGSKNHACVKGQPSGISMRKCTGTYLDEKGETQKCPFRVKYDSTQARKAGVEMERKVVFQVPGANSSSREHHPQCSTVEALKNGSNTPASDQSASSVEDAAESSVGDRQTCGREAGGNKTQSGGRVDGGTKKLKESKGYFTEGFGQKFTMRKNSLHPDVRLEICRLLATLPEHLVNTNTVINHLTRWEEGRFASLFHGQDYATSKRRIKGFLQGYRPKVKQWMRKDEARRWREDNAKNHLEFPQEPSFQEFEAYMQQHRFYMPEGIRQKCREFPLGDISFLHHFGLSHPTPAESGGKPLSDLSMLKERIFLPVPSFEWYQRYCGEDEIDQDLYSKIIMCLPFTSLANVMTLLQACDRIPAGARIRSYDAAYNVAKDADGRDMNLITAGFVGNYFDKECKSHSRFHPDVAVLSPGSESMAAVMAVEGAMITFCELFFGVEDLDFRHIGPRPDKGVTDFGDAVRAGIRKMYGHPPKGRMKPIIGG